MSIVNLEIKEINSYDSFDLTEVSNRGEWSETRVSVKENRMKQKAMLACVAVLVLGASPTCASQGFSDDGMLDPVEVVAEAPGYGSVMMPEVEVVARGPVVMLDEVESVAEGPRMVLDEVVVMAERPVPEFGRVLRVVLGDIEFTVEDIN